ncbi:E3 ubiquitin-protein ligase Praja-2-like [Capsicum annuum]|uniref:E3 ubiquitin-protein ligase Praja-2-like n=1 Tax=Capsicum annuum TaxID=4072 RepID=UPI001FB081C2|nr:E3 ubiquitin-protein ligase Praja-2-like [Capsicum annuum]
MSQVPCFRARTLPDDSYLNELQQRLQKRPRMTVDSIMSGIKFEDSPLNLEEEEEEEEEQELILDEIIEEEEEEEAEEFLNEVSLEDEIVEEMEAMEAGEFQNDVFESILDEEIIEEEEEVEEFVNDVSELILEVDVSENMEPPREWTIGLINEGHLPNQTSGTRARRTPRMRVNTNYSYYRFQELESTLDDTYSDELEEELEIQEEEETDDSNEWMDMSEYFETRTHYGPSPAMDIDGDPVVDEEQEVCAICLAEYTHEGIIASLECGHEFHVECINKWLQRKRTCPFCRAPVKPTPD